ncbi:MAG: phytoene/squalene synthase family protein [Chloroflexi bacterium]|nr:phytoene/squalene synthase family protein [Chloroflexota bacterium]MBU1662811.1 phytoene/squalene synthase family protein [Chloroflexota bacterium]
MNLHKDVMRVLKDTSRTFYIPVSRLPARLQETVAAAYLCLRAIDEIEDHETLDTASKASLLRKVGLILQSQTMVDERVTMEFEAAFVPFKNLLPEVTLRIGEWSIHAPTSIAPRIWDATAAMSDRMAHWVEQEWDVRTEADLDGYTFSVAGAVGLLLCDIWAWFDGTQIDRVLAIQFGRGLQAVNILRNRNEDMSHQVNFYPEGWTREQMFAYARRNLAMARTGVDAMPRDAFKYLVEIPLLLAEATLDVLESGKEKLTRLQVLKIVQQTR